MMPASKPRRRWRQFSLRTLLAAVFLAALGMFAFQTVLPFHGQHRAMEQLRSRPHTRWHSGQLPVGPAWLTSLFGPSYFVQVQELRLCDIPFTDADLPLLYKLPYLKQLVLNDTRLSPASLAALKARRPNLQVSQQPMPYGNGTSISHHSYGGWFGLAGWVRTLAYVLILIVIAIVWRRWQPRRRDDSVGVR